MPGVCWRSSEDDAASTYQMVHTVRFAGSAVFVLHCFQKKNKSGIATPEGRYGHHPRSAEGGRGTGTGATKCKSESLKASRFNAARAKSVFADLGLPGRRQAQNQDRAGGRDQEGDACSQADATGGAKRMGIPQPKVSA